MATGPVAQANNVITVSLRVGSTTLRLESSANVQTTDWQHIVVTWDSGGQLKLYINGELDTPTYNSPAVSGVIYGSNHKLYIGQGDRDHSCSSWHGLVGEIRFSGRSRPHHWIKGEWRSAMDALVSFSAEELY